LFIILKPFIVAHCNESEKFAMGKRKKSVALIESDSDDDSNNAADIDEVTVNFCSKLPAGH